MKETLATVTRTWSFATMAQGPLHNYFPVLTQQGNRWEARLNGQLVGYLEFEDYYDDGRMWLSDAWTDNIHQRQRIASNLMRRAVFTYQRVYASIGSMQQHQERDEDDTRYLTEEGAALVNSCVRHRIISNDWCIHIMNQ